MKVASLGGIEVIVSAMKRHSGHEGVQVHGCTALANLAHNSGLMSAIINFKYLYLYCHLFMGSFLSSFFCIN